ncbi:MAG: histidinol-phosphate transaminase [Myxococcales bacterium]|nr:histidinol-phosphate transaminase [Myxococcales bacterium]
MRPAPRPGILQIANYVAGDMTLPGVASPALLAANESPIGPSPRAVEAARSVASSVHLYPDADTRALNEAIARHHGLDSAWLMCGTGSESLIEVLCRTFAGPGDEVLMPRFSFPMFSIFANAVGATVVTSAAPNFTADVDALLASVTERTRLVFIANPNNPTGTWVDRHAIARLVAGLPERVMLVLDSAYAEYLTDAAYDPGHQHVTAFPGRVVVLRTFSKLYALAGLRIGWLHADPETITLLRRARFIFPVTSPSQAAAIAALDDRDHVRRSVEHNQRWRPWLATELTKAGIEVLPSGANFVLARFPGEGWKAADAKLRARGVIVRAIPPLEGLRISVGLEADNRAVVEALSQ